MQIFIYVCVCVNLLSLYKEEAVIFFRLPVILWGFFYPLQTHARMDTHTYRCLVVDVKHRLSRFCRRAEEKPGAVSDIKRGAGHLFIFILISKLFLVICVNNL